MIHFPLQKSDSINLTEIRFDKPLQHNSGVRHRILLLAKQAWEHRATGFAILAVSGEQPPMTTSMPRKRGTQGQRRRT